MVNAISGINSINRGLCPHGLPTAACPICSKQGGGGGGMSRTLLKSREMSWDECYAIGQAIKAQSQHANDAKGFAETSILNSIQNTKEFQAFAAKVAVFTNFIQANFVRPVARFLNNVFTAISTPVIKLANLIMNSTIMRNIQNMAEKMHQKFINISDKIAALIGEPLEAVAKFASEFWNKLKPKKFILFSAVDTAMEQGEQEEEVELKRWLHIKSLKDNIKKIFRKKKGNNKW